MTINATNIGEEVGPPWEEPAPQEWEMPSTTPEIPEEAPAEQPDREPAKCRRVGLHNCGGKWDNHDRIDVIA